MANGCRCLKRAFWSRPSERVVGNPETDSLPVAGPISEWPVTRPFGHCSGVRFRDSIFLQRTVTSRDNHRELKHLAAGSLEGHLRFHHQDFQGRKRFESTVDTG